MKVGFIALAMAFVGLVACSSGPAESKQQSAATLCVPNQTSRCTCGLDEGEQLCTKDGELLACECTKKKEPASTDPGTTPDPATSDKCGNGQIDPGEACDDGNTENDDGCSRKCQPDGAPKSADACPGQSIVVWRGTPLVLSGSTQGYNNSTTTSCYASEGPDRFYAIQPDADGFLTISGSFAPGFDALVEVRRDTCATSSGAALCEDTLSRPFQRVIPVERRSIYYLVVDGDASSPGGAYTLNLELR